jgi:alkylation response protein AidB-like acyl-CoA dehydrogenase
LLDFERSGIARGASIRRTLDDLVEYCRDARAGGPGADSYRPHLRANIADRYIEMETGRNLSYRIASMQEAGQIPNYEASMSKVFHSELGVRVAHTGFQVLQMHAQVKENQRWSRLKGRIELETQTTLIGNIGGGTSEVQRNIIATRGLGLPRG